LASIGSHAKGVGACFISSKTAKVTNALFFSHINLQHNDDGNPPAGFEHAALDLQFLHFQGIVQPIPSPVNFSRLIENSSVRYQSHIINTFDLALRVQAKHVAIEYPEIEVAPICCSELPVTLPAESEEATAIQQTIAIGIGSLPFPNEQCALSEIVEFRNELSDKRWTFRRFLHSLATKRQTEAELRDDIEWTINEYQRAMKIHNLKSGQSFFEVYVIPAIELAEDLSKFKWSKIAKGL
jgi:hypothetical protein